MEKVFRGTFQFAVASAPIHFARPASNKPPQSMGLKQQKITSLICSCQYQGVGKVVLFRRPLPCLVAFLLCPRLSYYIRLSEFPRPTRAPVMMD